MFDNDLSKCTPTNLSGLFDLVAPFTADQAGQSSSEKAYQAKSRSTFPDGSVLPGTFKQANLVYFKNNCKSVYIYLSLSKTPKIWYKSEWMKYVVLITAEDMLISLNFAFQCYNYGRSVVFE